MFNLWENGHKICMCLTFWAGDIESRCTTIESLPSARDSIVYLSVNASYLLAMWRSWFPSAPARLALEISADAAQGENLLDLQQIAQSIFLFGFVTVYIYICIYIYMWIGSDLTSGTNVGLVAKSWKKCGNCPHPVADVWRPSKFSSILLFWTKPSADFTKALANDVFSPKKITGLPESSNKSTHRTSLKHMF